MLAVRSFSQGRFGDVLRPHWAWPDERLQRNVGGEITMSLITQALDKMRGKPDGTSQARPFSDLSAHKVLSQGKKIAAMIGIESPFFRSTEGMHGRKTLIDGQPVLKI